MNQSQALEEELNAWSAPSPAKDFRILRVLVTAAVKPVRGEQEPSIFRGASCAEYFIRCDARQTELLFGRAFKVLLDSMRSGDESLSALYAKLNFPSEDTIQAPVRPSLQERKAKDIFQGDGDEDNDGGMFGLFDAD